MSDSTKTEQSLSEAWGENRVPIIALAFCFVLSHVLAMFIVPAFEEAEVQAFEDPEDPVNSRVPDTVKVFPSSNVINEFPVVFLRIEAVQASA